MAAPICLRDVDAAMVKLQEVRRAYLQRFGWARTCDTPGSCWMWRRDFAALSQDRPNLARHGIMTLPEDAALEITSRVLDLQEEVEDGPGVD